MRRGSIFLIGKNPKIDLAKKFHYPVNQTPPSALKEIATSIMRH